MSAAEDTTGRPGELRRLCVYLASSTGRNEALVDAATDLARRMAADDIGLVYGGGAVGLMGRVADEVMAGGGEVVGIIPSNLMPREVAHRGITKLVEVDSMHSRKAEMFRQADGFVALPGGFGTLEELAEVLTWAQLGIHDKPIGLLNVDGYYDHLLAFLDRCVGDGLLKPSNRDLLVVRSDAGGLLDALRAHRPTLEPKWLDGN